MSFISKWVYNLVKKEQEQKQKQSNKHCPEPVISSDEINEFGKALNITLYNATGGRIIKFHHYDRVTHTHTDTTYVIHDEDNLEKSLSQLITIESIK